MTLYSQTTVPQKAINKRPTRYKLFLLIWLGIYPLITIIQHFFSKYLSLLPLTLRTLILTDEKLQSIF